MGWVNKPKPKPTTALAKVPQQMQIGDSHPKEDVKELINVLSVLSLLGNHVDI